MFRWLLHAFSLCANIYALICVTGIASSRERETCADLFFLNSYAMTLVYYGQRGIYIYI